MRGERVALAVAGGAIFLAGFILGCDRSPGGKKNKVPRVVNIVLSPESPRAGDVLRAVVTASDAENDAFEIEYEWVVNDKVLEDAEGEELDTARYRAGTRISLRARAVETATGRAGEWRSSKEVVLGKEYALRIKSVKIEPDEIFITAPVRAVVDYGETDPDMVREIYYRWYVNGRLIEEEEAQGEELPPEYFHRGDRLKVEVCLDGLFQEPDLWRSSERIVLNSPPKFEGEPEITISGLLMTVMYEIGDPEGDPVSVELKNPPPGAVVSRGSTWFQLDLTRVAAGTYRLHLFATDGQKGEATYTRSFTVPARETEETGD